MSNTPRERGKIGGIEMGKVMDYYLVDRYMKLPYHQSIDENGKVAEGKHTFSATKEKAYGIALKRARKYRKATHTDCVRFYYASDSDPSRLTTFTCYGSVYLDTIKPFLKYWVSYIRYRIHTAKIQ